MQSISNRYDNGVMDIQETRRSNLARLIKEHGSQQSLADELGMTPGWISQMITKRRAITEKTARIIESALKLEAFAMDMAPKGAVGEQVAAYKIQAWEDEEELAGDKILIPVYDVQLSAGDGSIAPEFVETKHRLPYERNWIRRKRLSEDDLRVMPVRGDSMLPTMADGDVVLVDLSKNKVIDGRVYALVIGNTVKIKRLKKKYDGSLVVMSDNPMPEYADEVIPADANDYIYIIGQAVHRSGDL